MLDPLAIQLGAIRGEAELAIYVDEVEKTLQQNIQIRKKTLMSLLGTWLGALSGAAFCLLLVEHIPLNTIRALALLIVTSITGSKVAVRYLAFISSAPSASSTLKIGPTEPSSALKIVPAEPSVVPSLPPDGAAAHSNEYLYTRDVVQHTTTATPEILDFASTEKATLNRATSSLKWRLEAIGMATQRARDLGGNSEAVNLLVNDYLRLALDAFNNDIALMNFGHEPANGRPWPPLPNPPRSANAMPPISIPLSLREARRNNRLVPFVGAGLSLGKDVVGDFPDWRQVPERLITRIPENRWAHSDDKLRMRRDFYREKIDHPGEEEPQPMTLKEMLVRLDVIKIKLDRDYYHALDAIFGPSSAVPGSVHRAILALNPSVILTSNYDKLIEETPDGPPRRDVYTWINSTDALIRVKGGKKVLFKVHGSVEQAKTVILTDSEYAILRQDIAYRKTIEHLLNTQTILFLGYGMSDPEDLDILLGDHTKALQEAASQHFVLLREPEPAGQNEMDRRAAIREKYRVEVIPFHDYDEIVVFLNALAAA